MIKSSSKMREEKGEWDRLRRENQRFIKLQEKVSRRLLYSPLYSLAYLKMCMHKSIFITVKSLF